MWDRATVFSFGTETEKLPDRRRKQSVDAVGRYRLEPFLKFRGVKRLDYVWVTHGDVDHLNAVEELLERRKYGVEIQYLIFPEQKYWDERLIKLCNLAEEAGTKVRVMEMDTIFLSGKLKMRCLWPGEGEPSEMEMKILWYFTCNMKKLPCFLPEIWKIPEKSCWQRE